MKIHFLAEMPNQDARRLVASGAPVIALFNPVEFHGPHLPLDTDTLLSFGALKATYERLNADGRDWPLLIHSVVRAGCGAVPTNGTSRHSYREVCEIVRTVCDGIRGIGAKKAILMTFHGDPLHNIAIEKGVHSLRGRGIPTFAPMNVVMQESLHLEIENYAPALDTIIDPVTRDRYRESFIADFHGGFMETSLMLAWHADKVSADYQKVPPCPERPHSRRLERLARIFRRFGWKALAREIDFTNFALTWSAIRPTVGYTGSPHLANLEAGRFFAEHMASLMAESMRGYFDQGKPAPEPILKWVLPLSLGGRID